MRGGIYTTSSPSIASRAGRPAVQLDRPHEPDRTGPLSAADGAMPLVLLSIADESELSTLQPYPFQRLATLFERSAERDRRPINLSIGEPKHATPAFIRRPWSRTWTDWPPTPLPPAASPAPDHRRLARAPLRRSTRWMRPGRCCPSTAAAEALFAFAQTVVDPRPGRADRRHAQSLLPDLRRRGAARGRRTRIYQPARGRFALDLTHARIDMGGYAAALRLLPRQSDRRVMTLNEWERVFESRTAMASSSPADECYSEIYFDETRAAAGRACRRRVALGRAGLSAPGRVQQPVEALQRARDALGLRRRGRRPAEKFLLYRTYHGSAMNPAVQGASRPRGTTRRTCGRTAGCTGRSSRRSCRMLAACASAMPEAGFYLWLPHADRRRPSSRALCDDYNVRCCRAACWPARPTASIPGAGASCASPWSPRRRVH